MAFQMGIEGDAFKAAVKAMMALSKAYTATDATMLEINPFVITEDGGAVALDAKMDIDDNALFRHADYVKLRDLEEEDPLETDAIDHGLELALACDLRIAASEARLGLTDLSKGIVPWDGGTQRLPRLVGRTRALEMLLTSHLLNAEEACRWGLVNMVVEPEQLLSRAKEMALEVATGAPIASLYTKEAVLKGMDMTLAQGLGLEADLSIILQSTSDRAEGIRSFLEKRSPDFRGE